MADREPAHLGGDPAGAAPVGSAADTADTERVETAQAARVARRHEHSATVRAGGLHAGDLTASARAATVPAGSRSAASAGRAAPTFHVAGFWRRWVAGMVDLFAILPVAMLMCWLAGSVSGVHLPSERLRGLDFWIDLLLASDPALLGGLGLTLAIALIYVFVFQATMARTPGMRLLKMRIIDVYGDPPSTGRAALRSAGYLAGAATLFLGYLWIGVDGEKRGLHDWIAGTYVVKA